TFSFIHAILFMIDIPDVSGVKVLFQGVRFICALEGRSVLYPLTPRCKDRLFFPFNQHFWQSLLDKQDM
ncbi:MAG: hypothetical protein KKA10_15160, partial [Euryarchaeota archaeon]|nr:hypothetical protein [Euryarchaeota archaeon]